MPAAQPGPSGDPGATDPVESPDRRDGLVYVLQDEVDLAVDVALATGRPLLLRGDPGSGKSSLAPYIARQREWRYYEKVVSARTQATELLWTYDHVRRLSDAQVHARGRALADDDRYLVPGPLWWAFAPGSAAAVQAAGRRGAGAGRALPPQADPNDGRSVDHAVVLVDEIDKADPDLPNGLLVPLGSNEFTVSETGRRVAKEPPRTPGGLDGSGSRHLIVITTNEERELPQAFLRRCVVAWLPEHDKERLVSIAEAHLRHSFGDFCAADRQLAEALADELVRARQDARKQALRMPSTAEYLDALRACRALGIRTSDSQWELLKRLVLLKPQQPER
ncbi:MoxR family ATPase [Streptomyces sp. NBC_00433]